MLNRQRGMSLLEVMAAIAVGTVLFIGLTDMIDVSLEDTRGQQAAYHQAQLTAAAQKYIAANYATLKSDTSSGAVESATVADLAAFLPEGFDDQNSYLQKTCVLIRKGSGPERLDALVVGYGGREIPDRSIASVAMNAGQGAGYIPSTDTAVARGPSWSLNTTPFRPGRCGGAEPLTGGSADAGHLVTNLFYDGPGNLMTDFLYRDEVPGHPELNSMNVPLQMANAGLVDLDDSCTQTALALESTTKDVVVCDGGKWRYSASSWKAPVASWGVLTGTSGNNGDVRVTLDTGRAFVRNGGSWIAMAVDQNGDLDVPRHITGRTLHTTGHIYTDSDINVADNAYIGGRLEANDADIARNLDVRQTLVAHGYLDAKADVGVQGDVNVRENVAVKGNFDADGYIHSVTEVRAKWMATEVIVLDGLENPGGPCHKPGFKDDGTPVIINPVGTLARDIATGLVLNCANDRTYRYANGQYVP